METSNILGQITPIFRNLFNDSEMEITQDLRFEDIEEWSSLQQAIMLTEVEKEFGITFRLREVASLSDVGSLVALIAEKS